MPLPVVAVGGVLAFLGVLAKYLQATFTALNAGLTAVTHWFTVHKIIFSLVMMLAFVVVWGTVAISINAVGSWAVGIVLSSDDLSSDYGVVVNSLKYVADFVSFRKVSSLLSFALSFYIADLAIRSSFFCYSAMRAFVLRLAYTFRG